MPKSSRNQPRTEAQKLEEMHGDEYELEAILVRGVDNHSERRRGSSTVPTLAFRMAPNLSAYNLSNWSCALSWGGGPWMASPIAPPLLSKAAAAGALAIAKFDFCELLG